MQRPGCTLPGPPCLRRSAYSSGDQRECSRGRRIRALSGALMNPAQGKAFEKEIVSARALMRQNEYEQAFVHLERAHVLGHRNVAPHVLSHWLMLRIAVHRRSPAAMVGQAVRIVLGAVGSLLGSVPTGNTGGTNISMFKQLPIEPELLKIMEE